MKKMTMLLAVATVGFLTSCGSPNKIIVPLSSELPSVEDNYAIVWVGKGLSFLYSNGEYVRNESNDYSFEVVQRRYGNTWKSIKNMHRIHPNYDGKAGEREQTMFFNIEFTKNGKKVVSEITASLGSGSGFSDKEFREQTLQFRAEGISPYAPFNTYRITQHYKYEEGLLLETVELFKLEDGKETPFAKIEEKAHIFRPTTLESTPTKLE